MLGGVEHVAHGERELRQVVLDAQQLQRLAAVPIGELGLQTSQAADLTGDVPRIREDEGQRQHQADEQRHGRGAVDRASRSGHLGAIIATRHRSSGCMITA